MNKIKKGDIVGRKSYGKDIIFTVTKVIYINNKEIAILNGLIERIKADSEVSDLELIEKQKVKEIHEILNDKINKKIIISKEEINNLKNKVGLSTRNIITKEKIVSGKILHLDGDRKYSEKSYRYYKKVGLNAIVKNIEEYRQPKVVYRILEYYNPDILVITGHDGMIKKGTKYNDIYNYKNSKYFIQTVQEARRFERDYNKNLVIFAGACQSYYEAIISAGANFASSPARILIDFLDPLLVAQKVALTEKYKFITIDDIAYELRDGKDGISGIGANGKLTKKHL
ncbi:MAG: sporulation peptidase YabG [Clostridia bacterium]|nr:sporulation peptidase YabG [Clostridia bacterium]